MTAILPKELLTATLGGLSLLVVSGGSDGDVLVQQSDGTYAPETLVTGDVFGPASSTDNAIARFDATTGKLLQNCVVTIGDTGNIAGLGTVSCGAITASGTVNIGANSLVGTYSGVYNDGKWLTGSDHYGSFYISPSNASFAFAPPAAGTTVGTIDWAGRFNATTGFAVGSYDNANTTVRYYCNATGPKASIRAAGGLEVKDLAGSADAALTCGAITASGLVCMSIYTVATLPSASANAYKEANVSDALAPAMGVAVVGGGSVKTKVRSNGTDWTVCGI